ncbi:acetyltransferase [Hypoxylon rubiginosum]|uniref:Acetyltransferase n=1 Tax=Hypoxylon rubiginosum TaxID=110542 RepID=A0ACC0CWR9_9PEZI|nr:acetyltransferase [Hypoxylon rubiginosum]
MSETKFHIREVCHNPTDGDFIVAAFDSALPHLASVGSGDQWGSTPFSERAEKRQRMYDCIPLSEASRLNQEGSERGRLFIAEAEAHDRSDLQGLSFRIGDRGNRFLSVGAAFVREKWWPGYVRTHDSTKSICENADAGGMFCYLEVLISDFRTGTARKGAGAALLQRARAYSVSRGAKALFLDCWAGNSGSLVQFYTGQGFVQVADFSTERPDSDAWPGSLLKLELET